MREIGGFIGFEVTKGNNSYHGNSALCLNTGRACLNLIIKNSNVNKLYAPFYCCDSVLSPIEENQIPYEFYGLNDRLEIADDITLDDESMIIYVNYFGLMNSYIGGLHSKYGDKLILDNTQAFFEMDKNGINSFNSARKFFGVPDGAYLYHTFPAVNDLEVNKGISTDYLINRMIGNTETAYRQYREYEDSLTNEIKLISELSDTILSNVDYDNTAMKRRENYELYQNLLGGINYFQAEWDNKAVPYCYPFLTPEKIDKSVFHRQGIFIPTFWEEVTSRDGEGFEFEKNFSQCLIPLPLDQRYGADDIQYVSRKLKEVL
ncbi:MAG: hypothetical protein KDC73_04405 [Ignavibacteriae bacterium]|nr:hypothetical protein [Ignavibacteriota bacterium]MCB9244036.1 hypothetical protein [Ignavibacteriales bacterium]